MKEITFTTILFLAALLYTASPAYADWPQDAHDAQRTGYTTEEPALPWQFRWEWNSQYSPARGGAPSGHFYNAGKEGRTVAGGGKIYAPANQSGLYALDIGSGAVSWHASNASFLTTPAYDSQTNTVVAGSSQGILYKFNASSGAVLGTYNAGSPLNKPMLLVSGYAYAASENGQLHKVRISDMTRSWLYSSGSQTATPPSYSATRDVVVFATRDLYVHAVNNSSGSQKWRVKPTPNTAGFPNEFDGYWPVVADKNGVVFLRMRLYHDELFSGPLVGAWGGGIFPLTNSEIRNFLVNAPQKQNLFALSLDTGQKAFIPAVGYGGIEDRINSLPYSALGPVPVVKVLADGTEVAYEFFRSGQGRMQWDGRWDSHMGEMVLNNQTISGLVAGDMRFMQFDDAYVHITDEQTPLTVAGNTLFNSHWGAIHSVRIINRDSSRGLVFETPITTSVNPSIISRINSQGCGSLNPSTHYTTCGFSNLYDDARGWSGPNFWVYLNTYNPPANRPPGDGAPWEYGYMPRYTYVTDGVIVVEDLGGALLVLSHSGSVNLTPTPTSQPTPTPIISGPTPSPVCRADVNKNGRVEVGDISGILFDWGGTCTGAELACRSDVNKNGRVEVGDIAGVLYYWGQICQ